MEQMMERLLAKLKNGHEGKITENQNGNIDRFSRLPDGCQPNRDRRQMKRDDGRNVLSHIPAGEHQAMRQ
jgi:hypothetical protein